MTTYQGALGAIHRRTPAPQLGLRQRFDRYRAWLGRYRRALAELDSYRDHELNELGIARADIRRLAREVADRG